jgi:hypothetical protein
LCSSNYFQRIRFKLRIVKAQHLGKWETVERACRFKYAEADCAVGCILFIFLVMNSSTGLVFTMSEYHAEERRKNMGKEECTSFK